MPNAAVSLPAPMRSRRGITLIEVMMALILVAVGMLGIAGSSALLMRGAVAQAARLRAVHRAALRIVNVSARGCAGPIDSAIVDAALGMQERWQLGPRVANTMSLDESITWIDRGTRRTLVARSALLCP